MKNVWVLLPLLLVAGAGNRLAPGTTRGVHEEAQVPAAGFDYPVVVRVTDRDTGRPITGAKVSIVNPGTFRILADKLQTDSHGRLETTITVFPEEVANESYWVSPAYPNPVLKDHGALTIRYGVLGDLGDEPTLEVFDVLGRPTDPDGYLPAGSYFYRIRFGRGLTTRVQRLTLTRGGPLEIRLVPETGRAFLTAGENLDGVGRLRAEVLVIVEADEYSSRENGAFLNWKGDQEVGVALVSSDKLSRFRTELVSPDGRTSFQLSIRDASGQTDCLFYRVLRDGVPLVRDSRLGLVLPEAIPVGCGLEIADESVSSVSESWRPPYGQKKEIVDKHNGVRVRFVGTTTSARGLGLEVRAFDEGVAFRYVLEDANPGISQIVAEQTQIRLPAASKAYKQFGIEEPYELIPIYAFEDLAQEPLTVDFTDGRYAVVAEADNEDYPLHRLEPVDPADGILQVHLFSWAEVDTLPFRTPWRVVVIGDRPGDLIEHSSLIDNLSEPVQLSDVTWIRPGKAIRANPTTDGGFGAVDFANRRGIQYILFDAGWYGDQWSPQAYATRPIPDFDVEAVVDYASERGVGVFLYVNRDALESQLDAILPKYRDWGIAGIKAGFVNVGQQDQTRFLRDLVKRAAAYRLMVDIHDAYRPDGFSRTYPNLLTQEGVRGNEHMPGARHNTTLPFTRFVIGPADYTISYGNVLNGTSYAHQLALAVVFYSPLQCLFWADYPPGHVNDPAVAFWDDIPTVWDDTRVLDGRIGEFASIARRSGDDWYLGVITNESRRTLDVPLDFLTQGVRYEATIYRDDLTSDAARVPVTIEQRDVDASTVLHVEMVGAGGQGIRLRKKF